MCSLHEASVHLPSVPIFFFQVCCFFFSCCCDYLVSWLEYDYLLMVNAYNTHIDGQTDTNSLIFQVKS
jgi:hypothetical protein